MPPIQQSGLGLDSGTVYQVSGPGHSSFNDDDLAAPVRERTFYDLIHVVGPGDAAKLLVRVGFHVTFNNDGELVAFHGNGERQMPISDLANAGDLVATSLRRHSFQAQCVREPA